MTTTENRLNRIEAKLEQLTDLVTEVAHDSFLASAATVQLRETFDNLSNEVYDLRRRLGAPGYAPDRHKHIQGTPPGARERAV